jgi:hypothetical protein
MFKTFVSLLSGHTSYRVYNMVLLLGVLVKSYPYISMGHSIYRDLLSGGFTKSSSHITPALKANGYATNDFIREPMMANTNMKNKCMCREQNTVARPLWKKCFTPTTNPSTVQWPSQESRTKCFSHKNLQFGKITCFCSKIYIRNLSTRILDYITHQITKPMISGSQTHLDQLQHHFWTSNVYVT